MEAYISKWHRELGIFSKIKPLLIIEGNVFDVYSYPADGSIQRLPDYLHNYFSDIGYETIAFFDSMQGFSNPADVEMIDRFAKLTNTRAD